MPQIYTKDEIDVLLAKARKDTMDLSNYLAETFKDLSNGLNALTDRITSIETQHSTLLKTFHEHLDKSKKDKGTVSPYAR